MKPIDIFITAYERQGFTHHTIKYLKERTTYPFRLFLIDNGGNEEFRDEVDVYIGMKPNVGIHAAWNMALSLAESEYFITTDNDIYVPDLRNLQILVETENGVIRKMWEPGNVGYDWLRHLVEYMDERPDFGAISLHPHIFIGAAGIDPKDPEDVKERNMCGSVMRLMRTEVVRKVGGWEHKIEAGRNHEERTICSRLQTAGYKVGITTRIRAYHPFGKGIVDNGGGWGYPSSFPPEAQGHNPQLKEEVLRFDNPEAYDNMTWLPL